jgi:WD40 repeat protein/serine/threonine protein kinase
MSHLNDSDAPQQADDNVGTSRAAGADRQLLFGIVALQNDFITREQFIAGFDAWVHDKSRTLSEILKSQGVLSAEDQQILERLVQKFLEKHGGHAEKSLAALSPVPQVELDLERLRDPEVDATLIYMRHGQNRDVASALRPQSAGSTSLGRFRILRHHAKGGLGQISVALDQDLNREVALKEIQHQHADNEISRERFVLEAEITGGLEHPGIVPVYALGYGPDGRPFYAMRFVKGDSLKAALEDYHRPDNPNRKDPGARQIQLRQLLGRFVDVCNAMEYAHSRGVLHRDLKPGNIMVGKYGETLVVDWGLAKPVGKREIQSEEATLRPSSSLSSSGQTQVGSAIGTPAYMSPEQAAGKLDELGPASDVYSLGATLYHLLCGQPPFEKESVAENLKKVERGDYRKPRAVSSAVPAPLEAICLKAMALKPDDRYQTARALADDLEHWLADEPVTARPDAVAERLGRIVRKHRGFVLAGSISAVVVALISMLAALLINESRKRSVELASKNERLAEEKSNLADSERKATTTAQELAEENGRLAGTEREARLATVRQLKIATAERLAALSHATRIESPEISLALAVESGRVTERGGMVLQPGSHQALLDSLNAVGGAPFVGHNDRITNVSISLDGRWMVSTSYDNTIRIWDLNAEVPTVNPRVLSGAEPGETMVLAITADSRWVVATTSDWLRMWDISAEDPASTQRALPGLPGLCKCIAVSADGRLVAAGSNDSALVWDLKAQDATSPRILAGHQKTITSIAISPDNRSVVTGSDDGTARIWELGNADAIASPRVLTGHDAPVAIVLFSPDGRRVATGGWDKAVRLWEFAAKADAKPLVLRGQAAIVTCMAISPDGRWAITGSWDNTAWLWDLESDDPSANPRVLSGHKGPIVSVTVSPDNRWIVTGSADDTARVWDLEAENPAAEPRVLRAHQGAVRAIAISPDSRWIVTGADDNTPRIWDLQQERYVSTPRVIRVHKPHIVSVAVSPDSRWIVTGSEEEVRVWDLNANDSPGNGRVLSGFHGVAWSLAVSPDSRWVAAGGGDHIVRIWDLAAANRDAEPRLLTGHTADVYAVAFSPDGHWIVTGSGDDTARVWDMTAADPIATSRVWAGHMDPVRSVVISPDSRWCATISIGIADEGRLWNLDDPAAAPVVLPEKTSSAIFSPDSRRLITGATSDSKGRIWDVAAHDPLSNPRVLAGHGYGITSLAVSRDGRWLVTGSSDRTARVWDLNAEGAAAIGHVLSGHQGTVTSAAISPDGDWLVTGSFDNTVRLWNLGSADAGQLPRILHGHDSAVSGVAITPNGRRIVSWGYDRTTRIWAWQWNDLVEIAGTLGRNLSREEWNMFFGGESYRKTIADRSVPADPETAVDYVVRGKKRTYRNHVDEAIEDFTHAIRLNPNCRDAFVGRAEMLRLSGNLNAALLDYAEAIWLDPRRPGPYNSRAWLRATASDERFRNADEALADATRACELTEWKQWRYLDTLAAAHAAGGNFNEAVKWQIRAEELTPDEVKSELANRLELYQSGQAFREK